VPTDVKDALIRCKDILKSLEIMVEVSFNVSDMVLASLGSLEKQLDDYLKIWHFAEKSTLEETVSESEKVPP